MNNYEKLINILREIFQIDQADLDFGIYRIMNQKRGEIDDFLENKLIPQVKEEIAKANLGDASAVQKELDEAIAGAKALGVNPDDVPKVQNLKAQLATTQPVTLIEEEVFSHLAAFFKRYYDKGDFISLRRYKKDVYAIPYEGEEVKLYWANHDQYYIKSSEYLKNYQFKVGTGRGVRFELVEASTEQNNNKAQNGKERQFRIFADKPLEVVDGVLVIYFTYLPSEKKAKREELNSTAFEAVKAALPSDWMADVLQKVPTAKNGDRTLLEKHINDFTARNTFDYFIHKDLGGFLRRELDFYIKNEVLHIDDINTDDTKDFTRQLTKIKALKVIAQKVIVFLEQLENFQKRLWLKKKFVVETNYCITLDKIPESYHQEIADNEAQWLEWERLFAISELPKDLFNGGAVTDRLILLKEQKYLVLDTKFFSEDFKNRLLAEFEKLDEEMNGLLINSDNFQALELLQERYKNQAKCIYIDPPYNTEKDRAEGKFIYKDSFEHSSWMTMMNQTSINSRNLLDEDGALFVSCDENEFLNLGKLLDANYGGKNHIETITWNKRIPKNDKGIGNIHEYIYLFTKNHISRKEKNLGFKMLKDSLEEIYSLVNKCKSKGESLEETQKKLKQFYKKNGFDRGITLYCELDENYEIWGKINMSWPSAKGEGERYEVTNPVTGEPAPIPKKGWRWKKDTFDAAERNGSEFVLPDGSMMKGRIWYANDTKTQPSSITYLKEVESFLLRSILSLKSDGSLSLEAQGLGNIIDYPKPVKLLKRLVYSTSIEHGLFIDFFAGSGTTGEAIISLNREDKVDRNFLLIEMGSYFDSVTKPRIQKVIYSEDWKDGKPVSRKGSSHIFKYVRLESYEDTLNNLRVVPKQGAEQLFSNDTFYEEYLLGYMLDTETSESLLSIKDFANPFNYQLTITENNEPKPTVVDMVETFNYLIGLKVATIKTIDGFRVITGTKRTGEATLVIWRNTAEKNDDALCAFFEKYIAEKEGFEPQHIYINGDNTVANLQKKGDTWKVYLTEKVFLQQMFDVQDV